MSASTRQKRICRGCDAAFSPKFAHHYFCTEKCRLAVKRRRLKEKEEANGFPVNRVPLAKLLADVQAARDSAGIPRLELNRYLQSRAECLEAEEQLRIWGQRLQERKQAMSRLVEPSLERKVAIVRPDGRLQLPSNPVAYGAACTDGSIGVVVFGCIAQKETGV